MAEKEVIISLNFMRYLALLRGINVGGNHTVEMKKLKASFESLGYTDVMTYINSGNVIFSAKEETPQSLMDTITARIEKEWGFPVPTLVIPMQRMREISNHIDTEWKNDAKQKTYVCFLWPDIDDRSVLDMIPIRKDIEDLIYISGALIWHVEMQDYTKALFPKLIGTKIYNQMTMRNCNTVRKLSLLVDK